MLNGIFSNAGKKIKGLVKTLFVIELFQSKANTAKRITSLVLAGTMVAGGMAGCTGIAPNTPTNPNMSGIQDEDETGKYSALLTSVLNDEYYKSLMSNASDEDYAIPAFDAHPYAFLEDQGVDVDKILDGTHEATTISFVYDDEPNNLYIHTRILVDDEYYMSYLITYCLNDKEMADYKLVYGNNNAYSYAWPAFFMNDKISETKQPTKVLSSQYTKKTHDVFDKCVKSYVGTKKNYILAQIDPSSGYYLYLEYPRYYISTVPTQQKTMTIAEFKYPYIKYVNGIPEISQTYSQAEHLGYYTKEATMFFLRDSTIFRASELEKS